MFDYQLVQLVEPIQSYFDYNIKRKGTMASINKQDKYEGTSLDTYVNIFLQQSQTHDHNKQKRLYRIHKIKGTYNEDSGY